MSDKVTIGPSNSTIDPERQKPLTKLLGQFKFYRAFLKYNGCIDRKHTLVSITVTLQDDEKCIGLCSTWSYGSRAALGLALLDNGDHNWFAWGISVRSVGI